MYPIKKLQDCATIIAGQSPESKYYNSTGEGIPFFQGKADFGELYPKIRVYCSSPTKIAQYNDILLSVRAPVGPTNLSPGTVCIGRGLAAIRPDDSLDLKYLLYYFRYFETQLSAKGTGTTFKAINQKLIKNLEIPIPPLNEQFRIIARIEELFSELDKAVDTLKTTKEQLEVYRQAVLVDIFSQEYPLRQLKEISVALSGFAFKSKNYTPDGKYTVIKIGNVKDGYLDFSRDKTRTNEVTDKILQKYLLKQGDCLITLTGTRGKRDYGFVSMIERQTDYLLNQRVAALRFDTMIALPEFFRYYLSSLNYRNQFFKYETGNVGQGNVGIKALCEPAVPCPPLDTQKKIVDQISDRLSVCDSIEKTVNTALAQADAMRQSILKQAFKEGSI